MPHGPAPVPPAETQPVNHSAPAQQVMYLIDLRNPASHHGQPNAGKHRINV